MSGVRYQDRSVTRRQVLRTLAGGLATCALPAQEAKSRDALLEEIERRACLYFYEQGHPATGLASTGFEWMAWMTAASPAYQRPASA